MTKKELWLRATSREEVESLKERVSELSSGNNGVLAVNIYRSDVRAIARCKEKLNDDAVKFFVDELGANNVKVQVSHTSSTERESLEKIADALESIARSLENLDEIGITTFLNN